MLLVGLRNWLDSNEGRSAVQVAEAMVDSLPSTLAHVGLRAEKLIEHADKKITRWIRSTCDRWRELNSAYETVRKDLDSADANNQVRISRRMSARLKDMERYLDRFVVETLSRTAVIPTYSFPVHSIHLEIVTDRGADDRNDERALQLHRDAALAVSEYAPGAEVVAGGRIWKSEGITRRAVFGHGEAYIEKSYYRICQNCQHVEKHVNWDDFDVLCQQCGTRPRGHRRTFIEPIGFLTSYADRQGRDPGATRLRVRPVDEARLLTRPQPGDFQESDINSVTHFFAPAVGSEPAGSGQMVILNRGPKGAGYLRCPRCEFARPAPAESLGGMNIPSPHKNPRTGDKCSVESLSHPVDLAHIFETDLRGIRINQPVSDFSDRKDDNERRAAREGFLRTLAEAMRLAASDLLATDPRGLRATVEIHGATPLVILFDTTPGGAGFCRRILNDDDPRFSARALLGRAVTVLDCRRGDNCETSCSDCLNDYSNQAYWDQFDRLSVLKWLHDLLREDTPRPTHVPKSADPLATTFAVTLRKRLDGADLIAVSTPYLWGAGDQTEAMTSHRTVRNWLEDDSA